MIEHKTSDATLQTAGPLLSRLLDAQRVEEQAVRYVELQRLANQIVHRIGQVPGCVVWPVGEAAERVGAAVTIASRGATEVGAWNTEVKGRRVLVLVVAGVSSLGLQAAVGQLRRRGAIEVHGCGVAVEGAEDLSDLDSFVRLDLASISIPSVALVPDAA